MLLWCRAVHTKKRSHSRPKQNRQKHRRASALPKGNSTKLKKHVKKRAAKKSPAVKRNTEPEHPHQYNTRSKSSSSSSHDRGKLQSFSRRNLVQSVNDAGDTISSQDDERASSPPSAPISERIPGELDETDSELEPIQHDSEAEAECGSLSEETDMADDVEAEAQSSKQPRQRRKRIMRRTTIVKGRAKKQKRRTSK